MNDYYPQRTAHLAHVAELARTLPAGAVLSHESAALVLGLPVYSVPAQLKVTHSRGRAVRTSDVHVFRASLQPWEWQMVGDIPVTSPARTVVDLGRWLPFGQALVTADAALRKGTPRTALNAVLRAQWTWPRIRRAMPVVTHADGRSESPLESWTRSRFITLRLPMPTLQYDIRNDGVWVARSDFYWQEFNTAGEADGRVKYAEDELWEEKIRQESIEDPGRAMIRWIWRTAHATDEEFARRLLRRLAYGRALKRLRDAS